MATTPLSPNPETDTDGPDVLPPLVPDHGNLERVLQRFPIPEGEQEDLGERVPLEEEDEIVDPDPNLIPSS
jgi:hypothetical protein